MTIDPALQLEIDALVRGDHDNPFGLLGMHSVDGKLYLRSFQPGSAYVKVIDADTGKAVADLEQVHPDGFFMGQIPRRKNAFPYRLEMNWGGVVVELEDPYRFPAVLSDEDLWLLGEGSHLRPFEIMGAHQGELLGVSGVKFAVWAPNAKRVSVVGQFNMWDGRRCPMRRRHNAGIWEIFIPNLKKGECYKFEVIAQNGRLMPQKADPYAFAGELRPNTASVIWDTPAVQPQMSAERQHANSLQAPISVYEVHLGSWKRKVEERHRWYTYRELAAELVPYAKDMGFTHIELLPIHEYPFDGSWGYQPVSLYAPTSRYGTPEDFKFFVDAAHEAGLGVILDWVPGHFPTDGHGLGQFDGSSLFEHADPRQGYHQDWNTLIYNFGRNEVRNYLVGNALYWLERFGVDGLRVDAVASMLYNDYSRKAGEWVPNQYGGRENLEAVDFIRQLNRTVGIERPGSMMIAEESTAWPMVSRPPEWGGLGFHFKWNMGWMHDTLEYVKHEPIHRKYHHNDLTFGLVYAWDENFMLPLSHDEVVHGKGSILSRMPGDAWQKFANLRAYYGFMFTHPGKKLLMMGNEFAQGSEWNFDSSLDWHLLDIEWHKGVQTLVRDLNHLYRNNPAMHELDCDKSGFEWVDYGDYQNSVLSYFRFSADRKQQMLVLCNFTPVPREGYRVGVNQKGQYREVLNTDSAYYAGSNTGNAGLLQSEDVAAHGREQSLLLTVPPLSTVVLEYLG